MSFCSPTFETTPLDSWFHYEESDTDMLLDDLDILRDPDPQSRVSLMTTSRAEFAEYEDEEDIVKKEETENSMTTDEDESEEATRQRATERIEALALSFLSQLSNSLPQGGATTRKSQPNIILELANRKKTDADGSIVTRKLKFSKRGKVPSAKTFAQLFKVADLLHDALTNDMPTTKRDMYYKDVSLFKSQATVDKLVDDLAATFDLGRADLNVRAASKGLVSGSGITIYLHGGEAISVTDAEGTLIPVGEEIARFEVQDSLSWVLIVEKEAVFQTLCRLRLTTHPALPGRGILITGKGYPDVATRQLVKSLSDNLPATVPILALVDGDAYGLDILSVYKLGSQSLVHEKEKLAASRVKWIGLWASELDRLGVDKDALLHITKHDERKALSMLRRAGLPRKWRKELQHMLHSRRKAEIEILSGSGTASGAGHVSDLADMEENVDMVGQSFTKTGHSQLLDYLARKISASIADSAHRYAYMEH